MIDIYLSPLFLCLSLSLFPQYSHTSPHDDWVVGDSGQVAPSRSSEHAL